MGRGNDLETKLNQAGNEAVSSKRALESFKSENEARLKQIQKNESELKDEILETQDKLKKCEKAREQSVVEKDQQIQEMTVKIEASEAAIKRARDAEDKLLALQKESAALRGECAQAHKRVEAAESAARDKQIQFERVEATLEAKDKALTIKQQESANLAGELDSRRTEISELVIERDKLLSMEAALPMPGPRAW